MPAKAREFTVILEREADGGYSVHCPALPGCVSQGDDRESALENIREAIGLVLQTLAKEIETISEKGSKPPYQDTPGLIAEEMRQILKGRDEDELTYAGVSLEQVEVPVGTYE